MEENDHLFCKRMCIDMDIISYYIKERNEELARPHKIWGLDSNNLNYLRQLDHCNPGTTRSNHRYSIYALTTVMKSVMIVTALNSSFLHITILLIRYGLLLTNICNKGEKRAREIDSHCDGHLTNDVTVNLL